MIGFGKESPFLPGRLRDQFNALTYSKKEQFEHIADEIFSHFHQIGDVAGMKYLLNGIIAQRTNGPIEFFAGHMETLLVGSDCSIMIKVRDLETIKDFIERDDGFSLGGRGSGTRYRSGLSHAANEAALWYLIGRDNIDFTASNSEQASAERIEKLDVKAESSKQQKSTELDQSMPVKILFGFILVFAFLLVFYAKMEPASSRMPAPTGAPSLPTDSASAIESPTVSPQQTEPNETDERVHVATYSSEPYGANIIIDGLDYGRGPVTIRYTVPVELADGDKVQLPGGYAIWLDGSRSPIHSYFLTEVSPSNGSHFVFRQQVRTLPRAGQPEQPVTPGVSGVEPAGSKPADSSASAATAGAAATAQAGFVPSSGIWTGLGRDEGSDWEIIIKVTNANYVGQNVGISSYQDTVRFFGPCLCTLELISIEMDRIVLRERKNSPLSRECILSPAGKDITLINVNGNWSGTWRKRPSGTRVTMYANLQYAY